ncbi:MAG: hypothetical protein M3O64_00375 [Chloroflexota bacterium]|nr:hypothetical protein [Chloroflexota bacterium]
MRRLTPRARVLAGAIAFIAALVVVFVLTNDFAPRRSVQPDGFQRTADPQQIIAIVTVGVGDEVTEHTAREDASTVTVIVRVREPGGSRIGLGVPIPVPIALRQPLGERRVADEGGRALTDLGQYRIPGGSGQ